MLTLAVAAATWVAMAAPVRAQPADAGGGGAGFVELTPELAAAVTRGLRYLASEQHADGGWGGGRYDRHVGITALACIAFMADGHLPGRGKYGRHVERGLDFVLDNAQESGLIVADASHGPMYGHGFATLFLAEVYGQTQDRRCREALVKAIRLIVQSQNPEGGWRYHPVPYDADVSVTICQVMALRAARNAGISVPKATIDRAIEYVKKCQNSDGGFRYMLQGGGSAFPRSAAGLASLFYAGVYEGENVEKALAYIGKHAETTYARNHHYYYGHYYAAQAMFLAGGEHWQKWFPAIREEMIQSQQDDGRWTSPHSDAYGTAMALIILQVPNRLLPIFQR
jgi:squalene cyclase